MYAVVVGVGRRVGCGKGGGRGDGAEWICSGWGMGGWKGRGGVEALLILT